MRYRMRGRMIGVAAWLLLAACNTHGEPSNYGNPAHFKITTDVVNENVQPFTATISAFGNSFINEGGGFEPVVYRNKYIAQKDSPDRIVVNPMDLSHYDTLREGFLDEASVRVYRIENGRFRMVREGRVANGGSHASGWLPLLGDRAVLSADTRKFVFRWDSYNRPGVKYHFTVRAIDYSGNLSAPATAFSIARPNDVGKGAAANTTASFRPSSLTLDSSPPPAPDKLRGKINFDGSLVLEWDPVDARDLAGYLVYRSDYPPQEHQGYYLQLEGLPASGEQHIKAGDMVIVSKKFHTASRNRFHSNRVWGAGSENRLLLPGLVDFYPDESPRKHWELVRHAPDSPVEEAGETYMKLRLAAREKVSLGTYNHGGSGQDWYDVLENKPYKVEVWLRAERPKSVEFMLKGYFHDLPHRVAPVTFQVGPQWRKFEATFTPPVVQEGVRPNQMSLEFSGPGVFDVDNFRVYRADADYLDFLPHEHDEIKASGMQALRAHGLVKSGIRSYDMAQLTNPGGVISGTAKLNTLPQTLKMMRKADVRPWLQIEPHMAPEEWLALVEYLAAPYDPAKDTPNAKPWAAKRHAQGQTAPWTDAFDSILFELGNETWNSLMRPWTFAPMSDAATGAKYSAGQVYGLYQEYVLSILRASPYWKPAGLERKFAFVLGGWANLPYGKDAAAVSPSSSYLDIAAYNGGWDEAEGPPKLDAASFFNLLAQVNQAAIPTADKHALELRDLRQQGHARLRLGTYEAGPGYALNGLNGARVSEEQAGEQEQVMKSLAAGTATLDSFLARAYRGFDIQNFFTFDQGTRWRSHAKWYDGGQAYPSWKLLSLFNNEATGDMLRSETVSVPSVDLTAFSRRQTVKDAPLVAVYATRQGDRFNLFVISRKAPDYPLAGDDGHTPVSIDLPFGQAKSVSLYKMTGDPRAHNIHADQVGVERIELPAANFRQHFILDANNGAEHRGLPPASTYLYVFEGVSGIAEPAGKAAKQSTRVRNASGKKLQPVEVSLRVMRQPASR
ncbi:MAG: hypothetical protein Q8O79_07940 [Pseudomonadota bacterium]|nr:hypothetical protein [Pseudomonadota bacterium]